MKEISFKNDKGELVPNMTGSLWHLSFGYTAILDYRIKRMKKGAVVPVFKCESPN